MNSIRTSLLAGLRRRLVLLLLGAPLSVLAQSTPPWGGALALPNDGAGNAAYLVAMAPDAAGNVYVTGYFEGTVNFGAVPLVSAGGADVFVAKWSTESTTFVWVERAGGGGNEAPVALAVSGSSVYVAGGFQGSPTFGASVLTAHGAADVFVAKLTDAGTTGSFSWAQPISGTGNNVPVALAASSDNVYLTGTFSGTADFGPVHLTNGNTFGQDMYVAKLTDAGSTGTFGWAQRAGGQELATPTALAARGPNVYVAGQFSGEAGFGTHSVTSTGSYDVFVAKLTDAGASGSYTWAVAGGGTRNDFGAALAVSGTDVFLAGNFTTAASFGSTTLSSPGTEGAGFLARLNDAGAMATFDWALGMGGAGRSRLLGLASRPDGLYVAGTFQGPASFGTVALPGDGTSIPSLLVAKFRRPATGEEGLWVYQTPKVGFGTLAVSTGHIVCVGGIVVPPVSFGSLPLPSPAGFPAGNQLSYLASFRDGWEAATRPEGPLAGVSLLPNPAHGTASVVVPAVPGGPRATLVLLDALGRTVRAYSSVPATGRRQELDLSGVPAGLYLLRVKVGEHTALRRLLVE